jgi:hypothetical protein
VRQRGRRGCQCCGACIELRVPTANVMKSSICGRPLPSPEGGDNPCQAPEGRTGRCDGEALSSIARLSKCRPAVNPF